MKQRDAILVLVSVVIAAGIAAILLAGSISAATPGVQRQQFGLRERGFPPAGRPVGDVQARVPAPIQPILPVERGVAEAARGAAGYLLALLAVSATLVLVREQVLSAYRASLGGWRQQLRTFGTGLAVLLLVSSAVFLAGVAFLGALTGGGPNITRFGSVGLQFGLQTGFVVFAVIIVLAAVPALIGFAAASWRLGDALLTVRPLSRWTGLIPAPLVALLGTTLIYLLAQVPYLGIVVAVGAIAYALGAFVSARLDPGTASASS